MIPTIITAAHTIELIGSYIARHLESGTTVDFTNRRNRRTTKSAIPPLCRELINHGYDPQDRVRIVRKALDKPGMIPVFDRDRTLEKWAAIDIVESDTRSLHTVKYRPFPDSVEAKDAQEGVEASNPTGNPERLSTSPYGVGRDAA